MAENVEIETSKGGVKSMNATTLSVLYEGEDPFVWNALRKVEEVACGWLSTVELSRSTVRPTGKVVMVELERTGARPKRFLFPRSESVDKFVESER